MSVDTGIPSGTSEILSLSVGNVFSFFGDVTLSQTEIEKEDFVSHLVQSNTEVVGLDVSMEEVTAVNVLNSLDHLIGEHEHRLERKFSEGLIEERLKGWTHEIHNKYVVVTFGRTVVDIRDSLIDDGRVIVQVVVELALVDQLGMIRTNRFEFHCHLQVSLHIDGLVDLSKGTLIDLSDDFKVLAL